MAAIARAAEDSGFDSIWMGDHLLYRGGARSERGPWDVWTQLAALAAVTKRVRLGPLVAATAFHAPGTLARMAASVDEVSGGRLILGLGAGWNETEFTAFGGASGERPHDVPAVEAKDLRTHLRELERHGADEVIVVLDPIDERSVREVGRIVAAR